jgi:hypothetical protein
MHLRASLSNSKSESRQNQEPPSATSSKVTTPTFQVKKSAMPMAIKLGAVAKKPSAASTNAPVSTNSKLVASVFNNDSSSDEEGDEMPHEARMRMRNVGRETITSSGPNSFGKTKHGFVDAKKLFERQLQEAMENVSDDKS